jgi:hypothetical protein
MFCIPFLFLWDWTLPDSIRLAGGKCPPEAVSTPTALLANWLPWTYPEGIVVLIHR